LPKKLVVLKIKDGSSGHWKIKKIAYISALDRPVLKKFGTVMFLIPSNRVNV